MEGYISQYIWKLSTPGTCSKVVQLKLMLNQFIYSHILLRYNMYVDKRKNSRTEKNNLETHGLVKRHILKNQHYLYIHLFVDYLPPLPRM